MDVLSAYALISMGNKVPNQKDIEAVLKAAGVAVNGATSDNIKLLISEMNGRAFNDVVSEGMNKLSSGAAPAAGGGQAAASASAPAKEAAKAAKAPEPEPEEEDDDFGMGGLF